MKQFKIDPEAVYELVADEPLSTREVAEELGVSFAVAKNQLNRLHIANRVETTTPSTYDAQAKWEVADG